VTSSRKKRPNDFSLRPFPFALSFVLSTLFFVLGCPGEDITPPEVTIIAPADGDTLMGATTIRARATDNRGITRVEFFINGASIGTDATPAGDVFECAWLGVMRPGAPYELTCTAIDAAGNRSTSPLVTVHISSSAGTHHSGTMSAAETWTAAQSPHVIDSDLFVEAILTLQPGAVVLVADGATIAVGTRTPAGIKASGRADSMITLSALNLTPAPGAWSGIVFRTHATPESSVFRHCAVEYAGGGGSLIRCEAGRVAVDSCEFRSSAGSGVSASGNGLGSLSHSTFSACARFPVSISPGLVSALGAGNAFSDNYRNAVEIPGGTITATDTWPGFAFPYAITATLTVADTTNPLLFLASGCSLLFVDSARLRVGLGKPGALRADGTYGRIVLGPLADSSGSNRWGGLEFWERTDPIRTILNYVSIEGAGADNTAAVTCYAEVLIANTRVAGSGGTGINCQNTGFARFENDTITGCGGYPLHIAAPYVGTIGNGNSFTGNAHDAIEVAGGVIASNAQYRWQDVPYLVRDSIEVGSALEPTLLIENGVEMRFEPGAALTVGRNAKAALQADSVTFTGATAQPGAWDGIELHRYTASVSRLERCRILYGGGASHGILYVDSCLPTITGNEIAWSSNCCIYLVDRDITLDPDTLRRYNSLHDWVTDDITIGGRRR
jgi:hypothetical protein